MATIDAKTAQPFTDMDVDLGESSKGQVVEEKSLEKYGFVTGDLISLSIFVPEPKPTAPRTSLPADRAGAGVAGPGLRNIGWGSGDRNGSGNFSGRTNGFGDKAGPSHVPRGSWKRDDVPLPPQDDARGGRPSLGRDGREPAGGGNWRGGGVSSMGRHDRGARGDMNGRNRSISPVGRGGGRGNDYTREDSGRGERRSSWSRKRD
jgi:histone deacetylase complex subunit SAP18